MSETITYEYQTVTSEKLTKYIIENESLHKYFKQDWEKLKAKQYCGIINYDNTDYYILPKIANHDNDTNLNIFIYMLIYSYDLKVHNEDLSNSLNLKSNNILEVFIQMFAKNLFAQFQKGTYKEYITEQDNLTTLRGKYLINENLKYNFTNSKIYCEYDEFSEDNELNQFFLYAVKILMKYTKNKKLLKQCELVLNEVTQREFDIEKVNIHFNRLNNRFKESFEFALLLLKKSIPSFIKDKKGFAFLFDMNDLFELFIGKLYKDIDKSTKLQYTEKFGSLQLKPDIIIHEIIIDCKYKIIDNKKASREDRYQMYVYANNFRNIKSTLLLYPKHLDVMNQNMTLGNNDNKVELKISSIDLDFDGGYDEYIDEIKKRLENMIDANRNKNYRSY